MPRFLNALAREDDAPAQRQDWRDYLAYRFDQGRAAFARGEAEPIEPAALMDSIKTELGLS